MAKKNGDRNLRVADTVDAGRFARSPDFDAWLQQDAEFLDELEAMRNRT